MPTTNKDAYVYVKHPTKMRANFLNLDEPGDMPWTILVGITAFALISFGYVGVTIGVIAAVAVWIISMLRWGKQAERIYAMLFVVPFKEFALEKRKGIIFRATTDSKRVRRKKSLETAYPYEVREYDNMGLVYHKRRATLTMIFVASGSAMSSLSLSRQFAFNQRIAGTILRASAAVGIKGLELCFGLNIRPGSPYEVSDNLLEYGNMDALVPKALSDNKPLEDYTDEDFMNDFLSRVAIDLQNEMSENGPDAQIVFTVTIKESRALRRISQRKSGEYELREIRNEPLVRIRDTVLEQWGRVADDVRMLNGDEVEAHLRTSRDIVMVKDFYDDQNDRTTSADPADAAERNFHAPMSSITAEKESLEIDSTHMASFKLTGFPDQMDEPPVDFIRERTSVYAIPAEYYSVSIQMRTQKTGWQYRLAEGGANLRGAAGSLIGARTSGPRVERREQESYEELTKLDGTVYSVSFIPIVTVLATNAEDLEDAAYACHKTLSVEQFEPVRITGRFRQLDTVLSAITHIPS